MELQGFFMLTIFSTKAFSSDYLSSGGLLL